MTENSHSQSNSPRPLITYDKETDKIDIKVLYGNDEPRPVKNQLIVTRDELDKIARIIAYVYHEKREEYEALASPERIEHIYNDLRAVDRWLAERYQYLNSTQDEQPE